jgi:hypothetical protein
MKLMEENETTSGLDLNTPSIKISSLPRRPESSSLSNPALEYTDDIKQKEEQAQVKSKEWDKKTEKEANDEIIDDVQDKMDYVTTGMSAIPVANLVGSGVDAISAGVDASQGQYKNATLRTIQAAAGVVPAGKLATATGLRAAQVVTKAVSGEVIGAGIKAVSNFVTPSVSKTVSKVATDVAQKIAPRVIDTAKTVGTIGVRETSEVINNVVPEAISGAIANNRSSSESDESNTPSATRNFPTRNIPQV